MVVLGTVTQARASLEPLQPVSDATVVIKVERMYAGAEIAGDLARLPATVILSRGAASLKAGDRAVFYGEPRFIGKTVTIADIGETAPGGAAGPEGLAQGLQARQDVPLRARLAIADSVFLGTVEQVRPLAPEAAKEPETSEHAPDLRLAMVRVKTSLRGAEAGALAPVAFPASCDILWCGAPKLRVGEQAVIIAHRPQKDEAAVVRSPPRDAAALEKTQALLVTAPFDVRPAAELARVRRVLQTKEMQ